MYCLSDLDLTRPESAGKLSNLPLLVLSDGTFGVLKSANDSSAQPYYVLGAVSAQLLSKQAHHIITWHVSSPSIPLQVLAETVYI